MTNDAGDALENLARQRRPKIGFLPVPETFNLNQAAVGDESESPVLLFPAQHINQANILDGLVIRINMNLRPKRMEEHRGER